MTTGTGSATARCFHQTTQRCTPGLSSLRSVAFRTVAPAGSGSSRCHGPSTVHVDPQAIDRVDLQAIHMRFPGLLIALLLVFAAPPPNLYLISTGNGQVYSSGLYIPQNETFQTVKENLLLDVGMKSGRASCLLRTAILSCFIQQNTLPLFASTLNPSICPGLWVHSWLQSPCSSILVGTFV